MTRLLIFAIAILASCGSRTHCVLIFDDCPSGGRSVSECCGLAGCEYEFSDGVTIDCLAHDCGISDWNVMLGECGYGECTPWYECCDICITSQACGDDCIHASYTCDEDPGCACEPENVCE